MSPLIYGDRWWMIPDESYSTPTAPTPAQLKIPWISVQTTSPTRAVITLGTPSVTPGSYGGSGTTYTHNDPDFVFTTTSGIHVRENLIPGQRYSVRARAYSGAGATGTYGDYIYESFTMPKLAEVASVSSSTSSTTTPRTTTVDSDAVSRSILAKILAEEYAAAQAAAANTANIDNKTTSDSSEGSSTPVTPTGTSYAVSGNREVQRSVFRVNNKYKDREKYSVAVKNTNIPTTYKNYAFGAGIFFDSVTINPLSGGGIGFFTSNNGLDGYYVKLETTSNLPESKSDRPLSIFKVKNGVITPLQDSQEDNSKSLAYLAQGVSYKIDIRVKVENSIVAIDVFINNFKVTAADSTDIVSPTSNIALFSNANSTFFDYVYSIPLNETQYKDGVIGDQYSGRFGSTTLDFLYGDKLSSGFENSGIPGGVIDEFGTVARELLKVNIKYDSRPAFPIITSLGLNQFAELLGYRLNSFGAEVYVLNNAGTFIPLDDSRFASFSVIGNTLVQSGQNEYLDKTINEFTVPEQVTFESVWIQKESDAKSLSDWIKGQWSKKQSVCEMEVFSNPLISVGDIVTINYPSNGLDGTQKFIVSSINNSFDGGLLS